MPGLPLAHNPSPIDPYPRLRMKSKPNQPPTPATPPARTGNRSSKIRRPSLHAARPAPYLNRAAESYMFSPAEAEAWRFENRPPYHGIERTTPIYPSELRQREKIKQQRLNRKPKRQKKGHYDTTSYRRAIDYAIQRAAKKGIVIPPWSPNQLRHARGTEVRQHHGLEAAQVVLGHSHADVTEIYAERNLALATKIAAQTG